MSYGFTFEIADENAGRTLYALMRAMEGLGSTAGIITSKRALEQGLFSKPTSPFGAIARGLYGEDDAVVLAAQRVIQQALNQLVPHGILLLEYQDFVNGYKGERNQRAVRAFAGLVAEHTPLSVDDIQSLYDYMLKAGPAGLSFERVPGGTRITINPPSILPSPEDETDPGLETSPVAGSDQIHAFIGASKRFRPRPLWRRQ